MAACLHRVQMTGNHKESVEDGFTLIEVMVAMTILAIIAGIAFTVVFGASKRSRVLAREMELRRVASTVMNLVVEDLNGAFVREGVLPYFVGTDGFNQDDPSDRVSFITTSSLPVDPMSFAGDLAEVEYSIVVDDESRGTLYRREQSPPQPPDEEGGGNQEVTDLVQSLNIRYWDGSDWLDEWDSLDSTSKSTYGRLPPRIEVEMTFRDEKSEVTLRTGVAPPMAVVK